METAPEPLVQTSETKTFPQSPADRPLVSREREQPQKEFRIREGWSDPLQVNPDSLDPAIEGQQQAANNLKNELERILGTEIVVLTPEGLTPAQDAARRLRQRDESLARLAEEIDRMYKPPSESGSKTPVEVTAPPQIELPDEISKEVEAQFNQLTSEGFDETVTGEEDPQESELFDKVISGSEDPEQLPKAAESVIEHLASLGEDPDAVREKIGFLTRLSAKLFRDWQGSSPSEKDKKREAILGLNKELIKLVGTGLLGAILELLMNLIESSARGR